jgi:hypothetical protein
VSFWTRGWREVEEHESPDGGTGEDVYDDHGQIEPREIPSARSDAGASVTRSVPLYCGLIGYLLRLIILGSR